MDQESTEESAEQRGHKPARHRWELGKEAKREVGRGGRGLPGVSTRSSLTAYVTSTIPFLIRRTLCHQAQHQLAKFRFRGQYGQANRQVHTAGERSAVKGAWVILACSLFYDIPNTDHQARQGLQPTHRFLYKYSWTTNVGSTVVDKALLLFCVPGSYRGDIFHN